MKKRQLFFVGIFISGLAMLIAFLVLIGINLGTLREYNWAKEAVTAVGFGMYSPQEAANILQGAALYNAALEWFKYAALGAGIAGLVSTAALIYVKK